MKLNSARKVAISIALGGLVLGPTQAVALECPNPQETASAGTLKETKDDIATLGQQLQQGSAGNAVNEIIYDLRKKYPNATSEEVVNYMLTAYCPVVKEDKALSEDQARAKLDEFAMQVRKIYEN
ncbi:MAG: hypothetical protein ACR2OJ_10050 [Hyphomicrobiales bacterium]